MCANSWDWVYRAAKALGLTIPQPVLLRANDIIER